MPARTRRKNIKKRGSSKVARRSPARLIVFAFTIVVAVSIFVFTRPSWDSETKIAVAYFVLDGAEVIVFDPVNESVTKLYVPGETQVEAARSLGVVKIKNLQKLAQNEGVGPILLSKTLSKNLNLPILYYSDSNMQSYFHGSLTRSLLNALTPTETNLGHLSRIKLSLFSAGVINSKRISQDLSNYAFVDEMKLIDGSSGYTFDRETPSLLASIFTDTRISSNSYTVTLLNGTQDPHLVEQVVNTIRNAGFVTTNISSVESDAICIVRSNNKDIRDYLSILFGCEVNLQSTQSDVELELGSKFASEF